MYATLFDRPGLINEMLPRYLAVTPEQIRENLTTDIHGDLVRFTAWAVGDVLVDPLPQRAPERRRGQLRR